MDSSKLFKKISIVQIYLLSFYHFFIKVKMFLYRRLASILDYFLTFLSTIFSYDMFVLFPFLFQNCISYISFHSFIHVKQMIFQNLLMVIL